MTCILPYGSTHPAPPLPKVLEATYCEDIVKPVHKPTNPRKHCTQNTNWPVRLKLKQNDDSLSEELQSSLRPWASGRLTTEKWVVQSVCICWNFGGVRSQSCRPSKSHACVGTRLIRQLQTIIAPHVQVRENIDKRMRQVREKNVSDTSASNMKERHIVPKAPKNV